VANYSDEERAIILEFIRRNELQANRVNLLEDLFDKQKAFAADPSKRKGALTSRRAGKTHDVTREQLQSCLDIPGSVSVYATDTRDHAKKLVWEEVIKINRAYGLNIKFNHSELLATFPNRSRYWLAGVADEVAKERLRGYKFRDFTLDEAQSIPERILRPLLREVVYPGLADLDGTLRVTGTPNRACSGFLYDICHNPKLGFSIHNWTVLDNPRLDIWDGQPDWRDIAERKLEEWRIQNGFEPNDPAFLREYRGLWVRSEEDFIYRLNDHSTYDGKYPTLAQTVMGVDLGFRDEAAWVIVAYDQHDERCYEVDHRAEAGLDMSGIMQITQEMIELHNPERTVVDWASGGHHLIEEINRRYKVHCTAAEKTKKAAFMRLLNADLRTGRAVILDDGKLKKQIESLRWDNKSTGIEGEYAQREREGQPCDLHDAYLYAWREARHYLKKELDLTPEIDKMWHEMSKRDTKRRRGI
jgi:hypothetical protein